MPGRQMNLIFWNISRAMAGVRSHRNVPSSRPRRRPRPRNRSVLPKRLLIGIFLHSVLHAYVICRRFPEAGRLGKLDKDFGITPFPSFDMTIDKRKIGTLTVAV